jgi:D-serine deaminase-like pyridoxal phosphate-dependent protein
MLNQSRSIRNHVAHDAIKGAIVAGTTHGTETGMDAAALDGLGEQRIDWRFKGFPAAFDGSTVADLVALRPPLSSFTTPLLVLDEPALAHNIATMAEYCDAHGVDLAPHGKTTMAPQLFARQLAAGSSAITAATIAHVRAYRAFGVPSIVLGNQLIDPDALAWIAAESRLDPAFRFRCFVDSVEGVALMHSALDAADAQRPVEVVLDLGAPGGRTGCRDVPSAERVAEAVAQAPHLTLVGVGGFEGALAPDRSDPSLERIRGYLRFVREVAVRLDALGRFGDSADILLTAGGSMYFDDVVEILTEPWQASRPVRVLLRSGAYITHDDGHYQHLTPLTGRDGGPGPFRPALRILGRVLSMPEPGLALLDFGKRDAPIDLGLPQPREVLRPDGSHGDAADSTVTALADQHAFLAIGPRTRVAIGDIVSCGISHPCTAFDKWRLIPLVEDGRVVDVIHTFF